MSLPYTPPHPLFAHRIFMNPPTGSGAGWGQGAVASICPPPRDDATGFEIKRVKVEVTRMHQDQIYRAFYCHMEIQKQFISYVPSVL